MRTRIKTMQKRKGKYEKNESTEKWRALASQMFTFFVGSRVSIHIYICVPVPSFYLCLFPVSASSRSDTNFNNHPSATKELASAKAWCASSGVCCFGGARTLYIPKFVGPLCTGRPLYERRTPSAISFEIRSRCCYSLNAMFF